MDSNHRQPILVRPTTVSLCASSQAVVLVNTGVRRLRPLDDRPAMLLGGRDSNPGNPISSGNRRSFGPPGLNAWRAVVWLTTGVYTKDNRPYPARPLHPAI